MWGKGAVFGLLFREEFDMADEVILVVDDDAPQRETLLAYLASRSFRVFGAENGESGIDILSRQQVDLILTDYRMPRLDGAGVLKAAQEINPEVEVIMMTAYGTVDRAVLAMQDGAFSYLEKPIDFDELDTLIDDALEKHQRVRECQIFETENTGTHALKGVASVDPTMKKVLHIAARASMSRASVLVMGESGTGKELVARAIHEASPRKDKPFVAVNCAAFNENLLESELFGHERGAFTSADRLRKGRFEDADGGTLFVDEVGEIPLAAQAKLLRVLQERSFERVGGNDPIAVDVRLICATHRDLDAMVAAGDFRDDLYYRIKVVTVVLPPLRNRKQDIPMLIERFVACYGQENEKQVTGISAEAVDVLMRYPFPGNVRELQNIIEGAVVMARGTSISVKDLPDEVVVGIREQTCEDTLPKRIAQIEREAIDEALAKAKGVQSRAAGLLGITERNLRYKLKKYGFK